MVELGVREVVGRRDIPWLLGSDLEKTCEDGAMTD
jgi:hypothetical protein